MTDEELAKKRAVEFYKKYAKDLEKLQFLEMKELLFGDEPIENDLLRIYKRVRMTEDDN